MYWIRHDTSANGLRVTAGSPVGKLAGGECGCTRNSFPTGMPRVQVAVLKLTSLRGCFLTHFPTKLDVLRCVGKVLLTSFQTNRCNTIKAIWTAIIVSALIHVDALISSLQILFMSVQTSAQMGNIKVRTSSKYHAKRITFKYSTDLLVFIHITDLGAELFILYLHHFKTEWDVLGCVRKVSRTSF